MKRLLILMVVFTLFCSVKTFAQEEDVEIDFDGEDSEEMIFGEWDFTKHASSETIESNSPTIELLGGISQMKYDEEKFANDFAKIGAAELRLGYNDINRISLTSTSRHDYNYFFVNNMLADFHSDKSNPTDLLSDTWRIGFGSCDGYGWLFGEDSPAGLQLLSTTTFAGAVTKFDGEAIDTDTKNYMLRYDDKFKLNEGYEAAVRIRFVDNLSVTAGYETSMSYQSIPFWYWSLSKIIEGISGGILDVFIKAVEKSSPEFVPVVYFLLKNGLNYAFYTLRSEQMSWPIDNSPPMTFETFKVGLSFNM